MLQARVNPAGNTAGNLITCRAEWDADPWGGRRWVCTRWITWAILGGGEAVAAPLSLHPGRALSEEQLGRCQIQEEFGPHSLEIPAYRWSFLPSFLLSWPGAFTRGLATARTPGCPVTLHCFPRQEFSQEIPLSSPLLLLLLQGSTTLPFETRSPFKLRCLHYLEFGFINYLHLVHIKKS